MHLIGFIIQIYHGARSHERQIEIFVNVRPFLSLKWQVTTLLR